MVFFVSKKSPNDHHLFVDGCSYKYVVFLFSKLDRGLLEKRILLASGALSLLPTLLRLSHRNHFQSNRTQQYATRSSGLPYTCGVPSCIGLVVEREICLRRFLFFFAQRRVVSRILFVKKSLHRSKRIERTVVIYSENGFSRDARFSISIWTRIVRDSAVIRLIWNKCLIRVETTVDVKRKRRSNPDSFVSTLA